MRKLALSIAGAAALMMVDHLAASNGAILVEAAAQSAVSQSLAVDRTRKGDRIRTGNSSTPAPQPVTNSSQKPAKSQSKILDGCELPVSQLSDSAGLARAGRCVS